MSPRTGRPKKENPKSVDIKVRVDEKMNKELIEYSKKYEMTRTDVIRKGIKKVLNENK